MAHTQPQPQYTIIVPLLLFFRSLRIIMYKRWPLYLSLPLPPSLSLHLTLCVCQCTMWIVLSWRKTSKPTSRPTLTIPPITKKDQAPPVTMVIRLGICPLIMPSSSSSSSGNLTSMFDSCLLPRIHRGMMILFLCHTYWDWYM